MQYGEVITRSFQIWWRNRYLWILGALGGGEAVGFPYFAGPGPTGPTGPAGPGGGGGATAGQVGQWFAGALPALVVVGGVLLLLGLAYVVVSCIATGATIRAAAEHDAGRPFGLRLAWQVGLRRFWPILGLRLLVLLLVIVVTAAIAGVFVLGAVAVATGQVAGAVLAFMVGGLGVLGLVPVALGFGISVQLAARAIVLEQVGPVAALERGVRLLIARLGRVLLVWLIGVGLGILVGIATGAAELLVALPLGLVALAVYASSGVTSLLTVLVAVVPLFVIAAVLLSGAISAYMSAYWTLAFRRLELDAPPAPAYTAPQPPLSA